MSFNTKIRFTVLTAALALATAAPSVYAQNAGTWQGGIHTDPSHGAVDDGARHTKQVMDKQASSGNAAEYAGAWRGRIHTDASRGGIDDRARHTQEVMDKTVVPNTSTTPVTFGGVPNY